jgi:hypothetical protein
MLYVENLGMEDHRFKCNNKSSIYCLVHNNNFLRERLGSEFQSCIDPFH